MKTLLIAILVPFVIGRINAQDSLVYPTVELRGTASLLYGYNTAPTMYSPAPAYQKTQTVSLTPTYGYFVTHEVEVLVDVQYSFQLLDESLFGGDASQSRTHGIGLAVGAAYNYRVNPFFTPFAGLKIGASWLRTIYRYPFYSADTGWGKRTLLFPDILVGGRLFLGRDWSLVLLAEFVKLNDNSPWDKSESVSLGFGFSVYL